MLGYLDPGLWSLFVQYVGATCLALIIFFRKSVGKFFKFFGRWFGKGKE
ncbi:MAG: hypothetical protein J6Z25_01270 [Opitutales bacterium]|nr:hypothetical protein [Opitutales bacterium]